MSNETFISHDFKLPNHDNELSKAEDFIENLKNKIKIIKKTKTINDKIHDTLFEEVMRVLDYVAKLSIPVFEIEDELQRMYILKYKHSPELAKKLWLDHYGKIQHPYDILKNRCFRLFDELDEMYQNLYKKNPPNWKN